MKLLMSWSGVQLNIVGYKNRQLLLASTRVRDEVIFCQETFLKNLKSRQNQVPGSIFSMDTLGLRGNQGPSAII